MKTLGASLIACAIAAFAGPAFAQYLIKPPVMPVVVQVNAQGKVTGILPSELLRPKAKSLLISQLDAWIAKPAMVKNRPVASTFIVEVAVRATPRKDGKYDVSYIYVQSLPMPFGGSVFWDHINGNLELMLVSADSLTPDHRWTVPPVSNAMWMRVAQANPAVAGQIRAAVVTARLARPTTGAMYPVGAMGAAPATMAAPQTFSGNAMARSNGAARTERP